MVSQLDPGQIIKHVYDDATETIKVEVVSGVSVGAVSIKDGTTNDEVTVDSSGSLQTRVVSGTLVSQTYNEIDLTYIAAGNGVGEIATATYKLSGVVVATLTLSYDASNRLSTVVKS